MAAKSSKCGFSWLCCGSKSSVHPEPGDETEPKPEELIKKLELIAPSPPRPKNPALLNSDVDGTDTCKYYCPLCMMYFEAVYETACCGHTICDECALGYMRSASIRGPVNLDRPPEPEDWVVDDTICVVDGISALLPNACAFCRETRPASDLPQHMLDQTGTSEGFQLKLVLPGGTGEMLRNYEDSPTVAAAHEKQHSEAAVDVMGPSPLRVGDSFEKMKAKMVPFDRPPPVPSGVSRRGSELTTPKGSPRAVHAVLPGAVNTPVGPREVQSNVVTPVGPRERLIVAQTPGAATDVLPAGLPEADVGAVEAS
eukprot:TRINITY_DN1860_c0_g1_i2.p1 TRINITY_DN1860_c0_g1~~TRINITY_DN1860_c0_g1_i2.p1  ORF type:complete len:312 (-),score=49.90 TRINITY_DN1860_c0_g1_i2:171-1106(-)